MPIKSTLKQQLPAQMLKEAELPPEVATKGAEASPEAAVEAVADIPPPADAMWPKAQGTTTSKANMETGMPQTHPQIHPNGAVEAVTVAPAAEDAAAAAVEEEEDKEILLTPSSHVMRRQRVKPSSMR